MRLWIMIGAALVAAALTAIVLHLHPPAMRRLPGRRRI
ncbi:hypothetical protein SAMN05444279_11592 [Ruegeria intermedia]|uniref:Uncharacterized protein n=1 Tax=Ruegeria intermedia TaxID=996115 RepID=A0A1M4YIK6_9RHOB|nr:hypothetical protein SAMN05444279_11592 [Ruegeria intermedia]